MAVYGSYGGQILPRSICITSFLLWPSPKTFTLERWPNFLIGGALSGLPVWPSFSFATGSVGASYSQDFDLSPALSPTTYTLVSGSLPYGLALSNVSGDTGRISGNPTIQASYVFTLRATNVLGTADQAFTININAASVAVGGAWVWLA